MVISFRYPGDREWTQQTAFILWRHRERKTYNFSLWLAFLLYNTINRLKRKQFLQMAWKSVNGSVEREQSKGLTENVLLWWTLKIILASRTEGTLTFCEENLTTRHNDLSRQSNIPKAPWLIVSRAVGLILSSHKKERQKIIKMTANWPLTMHKQRRNPHARGQKWKDLMKGK